MASAVVDLNALTEQVSAAMMYGYAEVVKSQEVWANEMVFQERTPDFAVNFNWLQDRVQFVEGERGTPPTYRSFLGETFRIVLRKWENAVRADIFDVSADRFGMILNQASQMGVLAGRKTQDVITEIFNTGHTSAFLVFDGLSLYNDAHPKGGTTFDNLLAGVVLNAAGFQAARTAMRRFPSDEGALQPLDVLPTHLWVPPDLEYTANELMHNSFVPGGSGEGDNVLKGMAKVITDSRITDIDDWGLVSNQQFLKPFVEIRHTQFGDPAIVAETAQTDPGFRDFEEFRWWNRFYMTTWPSRPEFHLKATN